MVKITDRGLVPPDDPMFTGAYQTFSKRKSEPWTNASPKSDAGSVATDTAKKSSENSTK